MSSSRPNHCGKLANENWARLTVEGPKWACGRGGFGVGESCWVRSVRGVAKREGGGGGAFYGAFEEVQESEGSSPFFFGKFPLQKNFRYKGRIFSIVAKILSLYQLCFCRIKTKTKIKELKILKKILIKN